MVGITSVPSPAVTTGLAGGSGIEVCRLIVFDRHILELAGFEDLAAFLAFDKLNIFFAGDDLDTRVLTGRGGGTFAVWGRWRRSHKFGGATCPLPGAEQKSTEFCGIVDRPGRLSSAESTADAATCTTYDGLLCFRASIQRGVGGGSRGRLGHGINSRLARFRDRNKMNA